MAAVFLLLLTDTFADSSFSSFFYVPLIESLNALVMFLVQFVRQFPAEIRKIPKCSRSCFHAFMFHLTCTTAAVIKVTRGRLGEVF